jgi:hypothetical protein
MRRTFIVRTGFMLLSSIVLGWCALCAVVAAETAAPGKAASVPNLSAAQIADKNVAARGGLQSWRALQTESITGKMDAGAGDSLARSRVIARAGLGATGHRARANPDETAKKAPEQVQLPFRLELKQPNKSRLEIDVAGKTALQVYDGQNGWKLRPFLNRLEVEPFTAEEAKSRSSIEDMRGPFVDYAAKGTKLELAGVDTIEGRSAYKVKLTAKSGEVKHVWVDAQSFLDVKVEGIPRRLDGKMHNVYIDQRDFRKVDGLMLPFVYETTVEGVPGSHKMLFEAVSINKSIDDSRFAKPQVAAATATPAPSAAR